MLKAQGRGIKFSGGLDARLFTDRHVELLDSISVAELWFACDTPTAIAPLSRVAEMIAHFKRKKKRCYVMLDPRRESRNEAEGRISMVYDLGFLPFVQLYQGEIKENYSLKWKALQKKWTAPARAKAIKKANPQNSPKLKTFFD
jgi:hypothetical protein